AIRAGFVKLARKLVESGDPDAKDTYEPALTQARGGGLAKLERVPQRSSRPRQITIDGSFPRGTYLRVSTADGAIQVIGSEDHSIVVSGTSASSGSTQILGSLPLHMY
ncbi:hypothetical protein AJ80_10095, partial [Polytolypa hystricis UAMH7299]